MKHRKVTAWLLSLVLSATGFAGASSVLAEEAKTGESVPAEEAMAAEESMTAVETMGMEDTAAEESMGAEENGEMTENEGVEEEGGFDFEAYMAMMQAQAEAAAAARAAAEEEAAGADEQAKAAFICVNGYDWGPGVDKLVFELNGPAAKVDWELATLNAGSAIRTATAGYPCDEKGEMVEGASAFVAFELETTYALSGSPFEYDFMVTMQNHWAAEYFVAACFSVTTAEDEDVLIGFTGDCLASRISPEAERFDIRGEFTGEYQNPMTEETEELTLRYAAYEPEALKGDEAKNPLIIWLHGQGEGGTDPDIALLGNEVVALIREEIQGCFTSEGGENGAYVLVPQAETYWMDGGDGTNSSGDVDSRYTEILMDTINAYLESNEDVDVSRIYLGGCSNGGYMTMNMLVNYPDVFAAAFPNCEAYAFNKLARDEDGNVVAEGEATGTAMGGVNEFAGTEERWMTDEKIEAIKNIPIWFAQSADDTVVNPAQYGLPTYQALLKAGAENAWYSYFETVESGDDPGTVYMGHWVWTYLFNGAITGVQNREAIRNSEDPETFGFVPTNEGGGPEKAVVGEESYDNVFAWLNAQSKAE